MLCAVRDLRVSATNGERVERDVPKSRRQETRGGHAKADADERHSHAFAPYETHRCAARGAGPPAQLSPAFTRKISSSDGDPGVDLRQVETERTLRSGTDEANGPQLRFADLALNLGLRLMTGRAFMNGWSGRKLGVPHEAHTITVSSSRLRCSAHRPSLRETPTLLRAGCGSGTTAGRPRYRAPRATAADGNGIESGLEAFARLVGPRRS
jgi:hypothetical protein